MISETPAEHLLKDTSPPGTVWQDYKLHLICTDNRNMADHTETGDDHLHYEPAEPEKAADKPAPPKEEEKEEHLTTIQDSEHMEVHHHSHPHGHKNWRTYAWEFAMLFLAVFCGFLAEYFLEHRIEN